MQIEINNSKTINVVEQTLIVKNNKLFNVITNTYEAIDGDKIEFCTFDSKGNRFWMSGTVDGYTCSRRIKLKGVSDLYACVDAINKIITHKSTITNSDYVDAEKEAEDDFELVLKGV